MFIIPLSWCGTQRDLEPLNRCFVGLDKYESIYLSRSSTEYPSRGFLFSTLVQFASVLRTILRTLDGGCAEGKLFALNQGGRAPEIAKSRDKRVRSIDDDYERGTLKPYPIYKALAPVVNWDYESRGLRRILVIKLIIISSVALVLSFN